MRASIRLFPGLILGFLLAACVSTENLQLSNGKGASFIVTGKSYEQIWRAATQAMSTDMRIVESHQPTGVIKSKVVNGTTGKVVGFFVQPTDDNAARYTITIVSQKPLQTDLVDRDWEPSVWADFKQALTR
jgi:hypothetical protein